MSLFRQVAGIWLTPDFTAVERGEVAALQVNHNEVDFAALAAFMSAHFACGEKVRLRLPNDTVDHATVLFRMLGQDPEAANCHDFAERLLDAVQAPRTPTPVRERWAALHRLKDRSRAPPPKLLLFVAEGAFEAVQVWFAQAAARLNMRAAAIAANASSPVPRRAYDGRLTPELTAVLTKCFGVPYHPSCFLDKLASRQPRHWAAR